MTGYGLRVTRNILKFSLYSTVLSPTATANLAPTRHRSLRTTGYRMGSMQSTSSSIRVLPKRTASSSLFAKRGSCAATVSSDALASAPTNALSHATARLDGSMISGAAVTRKITIAFSMESVSPGRPCCFHVSISVSVDMNRLRSNGRSPTPRYAVHRPSVATRVSSGDDARYAMNPAASKAFRGRAFKSASRLTTWPFHRSFSPPSFPRSRSAAKSESCAFFKFNFSASASLVRRPNSSFISTTSKSSATSSFSHSSTRFVDVSSDPVSCFKMFSSGAIFSRTRENLTFALTHAASGAAATLTRRIFLCSNKSAFSLRIFLTISLFFAVTTCASKLTISSFTPRDPKNFFCPAQLVSGLFIRSNTASNTTRIPSGGVRRDLISLMLSDLIWPTAARAESINGWTSLSSSSMPTFCTFKSASSLLVFSFNVSTSFFLSLAADMLVVIRDNASSARCCFSANNTCCSAACTDSSATAPAASSSFVRPAVRWFLDVTWASRLLSKIRAY